jgi:hypothetical protein
LVEKPRKQHDKSSFPNIKQKSWKQTLQR